jgi:hypothetical protein
MTIGTAPFETLAALAPQERGFKPDFLRRVPKEPVSKGRAFRSAAFLRMLIVEGPTPVRKNHSHPRGGGKKNGNSGRNLVGMKAPETGIREAA